MKIKIIIFVSLFIGSLALSFTLRSQYLNIKRLKANNETLLTGINHYKTKDSLNVVSIGKLTQTKSEFKRHNEELQKDIESLNLKIRNIQSVSQTATETKIVFKTLVKDSLIIRENHTIDTIQCMNYKDPYVLFDGCIENNDLIANISVNDTLIQVIHKVPKKFLFLRIGIKGIRQEVLSKNPYTNISYQKYIELKK